MNPIKTNWKLIGVVLGVVLLVVMAAVAFLGTRRREPGFTLTHEEVCPGSGAWVMTSYWRITNTADSDLVVKRVVYNGEFDAEPVWEPRTAHERSELNKSFIRGLQRMGEEAERREAEEVRRFGRRLRPQESEELLGPIPHGEPPPLPPVPMFPIRLTVGESVKVLEWNFGGGGYETQVVYVDVHTNRGRFCYRPARLRFE